MARLITSGFELNSATAGVEVDTYLTGSATIVSSPVHSGSYALQCVTSATTAQPRYKLYSGTGASNKIYARAWINISSFANTTGGIIGIYNSGTVQLCKILFSYSTHKLTIVNAASVQIGAASATLNTNTWYCVELFLDASVSNGTVEGRLNGSVFASGAGTATGGASSVIFGVMTAATTTITFDDMAVNDNTGSYQTGYPGLGNIVRATPNAAGDSNTFLTQVGGTAGSVNNYTRVNETTPDGTTSYNANVTAASDLFGVSVPTIPAGATINCVVVGGQFANLTGADTTASFQWQIEKTSGGTISKSSAIIPNSTTMAVNRGQPGASTYLHTLYNDPDGNPWTPSTIASMQIGYLVDVAHTDALAISTVWALVDYTPYSNKSSFFDLF